MALAELVNGAGDEFLAGPRFAGQEDGGVGAGDDRKPGDGRAKRRSITYQSA